MIQPGEPCCSNRSFQRSSRLNGSMTRVPSGGSPRPAHRTFPCPGSVPLHGVDQLLAVQAELSLPLAGLHRTSSSSHASTTASTHPSTTKPLLWLRLCPCLG